MSSLARQAAVLGTLTLLACTEPGAPTASNPKPGAGPAGAAKPAAPAVAPGAAAPAAAAAPGVAPTAAGVAEAETIFAQRCVACHGADGKGEGAAAAALNPRPRNYTDKAWQATVSDAAIEKTIVEGGLAVGKSPLMPPNPDLAAKPDVVAGLRAKVRGFGK